MKEQDLNTDSSLRKRAEERLEGVPASLPVPEDTAAILHDLRVHQVELEMQNDELQRTQHELDAARRKYVQLFDLAPVGYVTLDEAGNIMDANLTAASLLGVNRSSLVGLPFVQFVLPPDADGLILRLRETRPASEPRALELRMRRSAGKTMTDQFWARLEIRGDVTEEVLAPSAWVTFADITSSKGTC